MNAHQRRKHRRAAPKVGDRVLVAGIWGRDVEAVIVHPLFNLNFSRKVCYEGRLGNIEGGYVPLRYLQRLS